MFAKRDLEIQKGIETGDITQEGYVEKLKQQIEKDKLFADYFETIGDDVKKKVVLFRIQCSEKEMSGDMQEE